MRTITEIMYAVPAKRGQSRLQTSCRFEAAKVLPLLGPATSKLDLIYCGHGAQRLYCPSSVEASGLWWSQSHFRLKALHSQSWESRHSKGGLSGRGWSPASSGAWSRRCVHTCQYQGLALLRQVQPVRQAVELQAKSPDWSGCGALLMPPHCAYGSSRAAGGRYC
jgi:hypothetical protein